jgi:hypothetical protein
MAMRAGTPVASRGIVYVDEEAQTGLIHIDPTLPRFGKDTRPVDVLQIHEPSDTVPCDMIACSVETADLQILEVEADDTDFAILISRPSREPTNADWPPSPREPASRQFRRAGMLKAITSSSLINIK